MFQNTALVLCVAVGSGAYLATLSGQDLPKSGPGGPSRPQSRDDASARYQQTVLPVLAKSCFGCHSDRVHTAGLSLEALQDPALALQKPEVWSKVLDKLKAGTMPPRNMPQLLPGDVAIVTDWILSLQGGSHADAAAGAAAPVVTAANADPGRVTARRLNRAEYNNTIHDLLGVTLRPADEFPADDSGYGFDNIGDVLSLSPMLMEKYLSAARTVSKAAVFGESYPLKPTRLTRLMPKKIQDDVPAGGTVTPFSARGAMYTTYHVPVDGEYEFRFRYQNFRGGEPVMTTDGPVPARGGGRGRAGAPGAADAPAAQGGPGAAAGAPQARGAGAGRGRGGFVPRELTEEQKKARLEALRTSGPPEPIVFTVDGQEIYRYVVEGTTDYEYSRGESVARIKLTAGDHALRVSFPGLANMANPRAQFNPDGRRKLYVDYFDVLGPYNPSTEPPASFKRIFICGPLSSSKGGQPGNYSADCARQIIDNLVTRAYRRPATPQEVKTLLGLVTEVRKHDSFEEGVRVALQAILASPNFLFRVERDQPVSAPPVSATTGTGAYLVNDYELASRLSYFLWNTMPDDALFEAAAKKQLHDPSVLSAQVHRMLHDPKAAALANSFGSQWLNLGLMDRKKPDAQKFLMVDDELLDAMRQETLMFVSTVIKEDRSILDFIDGKFTFVNGPLARYYGIKGVDGEQMQRVDLDGDQRSGIVTQGAVLSISSYATRTSPVLRGKWVLDNLLGAAPPPPPDGIPPLVESGLGTAASMRQRLEQHRANPSCAVCHNQMDPIGFGLENYDAAGAYRTKDGEFDIDSSGTLPDGRSFVGAKGLKQTLRAQSGAFTHNFTEKLMTYALGRGLERFDRPVVDQISRDLAQSDYKFTALVTAIVNSRPFQMRSRDGGAQ